MVGIMHAVVMRIGSTTPNARTTIGLDSKPPATSLTEQLSVPQINTATPRNQPSRTLALTSIRFSRVLMADRIG